MNEIYIRRSVRSFAKDMVENEKIIATLKAAMQAPSAGNQQPWEFVVIKDKETIEALSETHMYASTLADAPVAIVVASNTENLRYIGYEQQDLAAATQNLMLEAVTQGLGTIWYGVVPEQERVDYIAKVLNLPKNMSAFALIGMGYPSDKNANKFVDRYDESRVHFEKFEK